MSDPASSSASSGTVSLNVKGPSEIKLTVTIAQDATVRQLKEDIAKQHPDVPADSQRLIYAGKVLKDEQQLTEYKVKDGHTIHLVKSASRSAPVTGNPQTGSSQPSANPSAPASTGAGGGGSGASSAAQGVPSNFGAGQQFTNNPLAALNRADLAGPHMANIGRNLFQGTGMNPTDPNMMMNALDSPEFQQHMRSMLRRPEVIDQMIAMNPQMAAMGPQMREMMQSDGFIDMMTDPATMRRMMQLQGAMGGGGGGGLGGLAGAGAGGGGGGSQWPPPGAFGTPSNDQQRGGEGGQQPQAAQNPFAALGGLGGMGGAGGAGQGGQQGGAGGGPGSMFDPQLLQQILGGGGGGGAGGMGGMGGMGGTGGMGGNPLAAFGGGGSALGGQGSGGGAAPGDSRPPEERFSSQLQSLQDMGFVDGQANLRALLISGGSVEGAINILLGG